MHECTTQQLQPQRSGKKHIADTRGIAERTNWWEMTPEAIQIFLEHAITQPRQPRDREPSSSWTHEPHWSADQRQHADTPIGLSELPCSDTRRHWLLRGKTYLTMAAETQAQVNHMVGECWCKAPHKHNRVSHELHPLIQRHIMKTNDRQSSRTLTHGPRNNSHNRTCRRTWITLRHADTADTYDTTHILRLVSIGQFHVPLSPQRSGAVTYPHGPKKKQHATRQQKHKTCQHT